MLYKYCSLHTAFLTPPGIKMYKTSMFDVRQLFLHEAGVDGFARNFATQNPDIELRSITLFSSRM